MIWSGRILLLWGRVFLNDTMPLQTAVEQTFVYCCPGWGQEKTVNNYQREEKEEISDLLTLCRCLFSCPAFSFLCLLPGSPFLPQSFSLTYIEVHSLSLMSIASFAIILWSSFNFVNLSLNSVWQKMNHIWQQVFKNFRCRGMRTGQWV